MKTYLAWSLASGAFIPVMAILNARLGRALGEPLHASVVLLCVGLVAALLSAAILTRSAPELAGFGRARPADYLGGLVVAFYVVSATLLAPRMGVGNFIVCAVSAQILSAMVIDHLGLFGAAVRPMNLLRGAGVVLLLAGIVMTQLGDPKS
jgi:bacterial/archaeal transporter family-2 protein